MSIPESLLVCFAISRLVLEAYTKQQPNSWTRKFESVHCELQETALLAKLAAGDMIAIEAKYHNRCLCALYNRAIVASPMDNDGVDACMQGIAFTRTDWSILESLWIAEFIAPG